MSNRCPVGDENLGQCVLDAHEGNVHAWEGVAGPPGPPQRWQIEREALATHIRSELKRRTFPPDPITGVGGLGLTEHDLADAILASDWLAEDRARIRREALDEVEQRLRMSAAEARTDINTLWIRGDHAGSHVATGCTLAYNQAVRVIVSELRDANGGTPMSKPRDAQIRREFADEVIEALEGFDCLTDHVPTHIDVPDDYEAGIHDAARIVANLRDGGDDRG